MGSRTRLIPAGLAESDGHGWLVQSEEGSWGNWLQSDTTVKSEAATEVRTVTLAEAFNGCHPVLIKCNAEGAEYELVRQLLALNLRPKLMIMMVHPEHGDDNHLRATLIAAGFRVVTVRREPYRPIWHVEPM